MYKSQVIRKIVAVCMLIVFAFSITPAIVFHNWFANHTDTVNKATPTSGNTIGKITINCNCDNIVAESPFTEPVKIIPVSIISFFSIAQTGITLQFASSPHISYSLRGPPVV